MDAEGFRSMARRLPHVRETMQWGENLVFWVGDKTAGGKMFALANLDGDGRAVVSFASPPERRAELLERDGVVPAPYLARAGWVALERWDVLPRAELAAALEAAHGWVWARLPRRMRVELSGD